MNQEMAKLYSELVSQREDLVQQLDRLHANHRKAETRYDRDPSEGRLRREITWRESQVIALLGGIVHWEYNG